MIYFKCKSATVEGELLGFVAPSKSIDEPSNHFYYDPPVDGEEIHALDILPEQVAEILAMQHPQCEVEQVEFSTVEEALKTSRLYLEINERTVSRIRVLYDINREFSIMKLGKTDPEYIAMIDYINACRATGTEEKIAIGLKQA